MWPNVSDPASPHSGASGIAPMPAPSRTTRVILLNLFIVIVNTIGHSSFDTSHLSFVASSRGERARENSTQLFILDCNVDNQTFWKHIAAPNDSQPDGSFI